MCKKRVCNTIQDGIRNEEFFPDSSLTGGSIQNNRAGAIWNKRNGSVTIGGSAEISGDQGGEVQLRAMAVRSQAQSKAVIKNEKKSILNIKGRTITAAGTAIGMKIQRPEKLN